MRNQTYIFVVRSRESGFTGGGKWSPRRELNSRLPPYRGGALPLSYMGKRNHMNYCRKCATSIYFAGAGFGNVIHIKALVNEAMQRGKHFHRIPWGFQKGDPPWPPS